MLLMNESVLSLKEKTQHWFSYFQTAGVRHVVITIELGVVSCKLEAQS